MNSMMRIKTISWHDAPAYKVCEVFCPGCQYLHHVTVEILNSDFKRSDGSPPPIWSWDGNEESPTFSPSILAYNTVHFCEGEHVITECYLDFSECEHRSHGYAWKFPDGSMCHYKTYEQKPVDAVVVTTGPDGPHTKDPAWGNCHSFLTNGIWDFLSDCGHTLAGQKIPMVPIPDWFIE